MIVRVEIAVKEGDKCLACNYKAKNKWENGTVQWVRVGIDRNGNYTVSYRVLLDRRTTGRSRMFREGGAPIFLQCNTKQILPL